MFIFLSLRVAAILVLCVTVVSESIDARPAIIHEKERVVLPDQYFRTSGICLVGDDLLVLANRLNAGGPSGPDLAWAVVHFAKQASGDWRFMAELAVTTYDSFVDIWVDEQLACDGPVAGFSAPEGESFILERSSSGWVATSVGIRGSDVAVYGESVAFGGRRGGSPTAVAVYTRDMSGAWTDVRYAIGLPGYRQDGEIFGPTSIGLASAELAATGSAYTPEGQLDEVSDTQVFDLIDGAWQLTDTLPESYGPLTIGNRVALLLDSWTEPGDVGSFFTRDASGAWTVEHTLLSDESLIAWEIILRDRRAFMGVHGESGGIAVLSEQEPRRYRHETTLLPSDLLPIDQPLSKLSVDGEWVAAAGENLRNVYLFEIPATLPTPQLIEATFEDNSAADWSVWGASDWRIVSSRGSRVYRQLNTQGGARAILETSEGTDQSVQADVRILSGAGPAPWAGLMVRYTDPQNFYYLLVDNGSVQIRRIVNGAFAPLVTAPFNLVPGRAYRLRLEAIGQRIRAFVNGAMVAEVIDDTHANGRAGLTMWRSDAEYDNVVVTSSPQVSLFTDSFEPGSQRLPWASSPASAWGVVRVSDSNRVFRQSMTTRSAHAIHGAPTEDQIIAAKVQPRAFNASGRGSVGLILRYVDSRNFYYARLTDANTVILGMQLNGVHRTIDQATLTVNPNTVYNVRAEAIGSSLRVYVNDKLFAEGQDVSFPRGRYGLLTFEAAADFNDFKVVRP